MAKRKRALKKAKKFSEAREVEKKLRGDIADITARLNRSDLTAAQGKRHAESLVKAYRRLTKLEKLE
jgi:hypothetical protein